MFNQIIKQSLSKPSQKYPNYWRQKQNLKQKQSSS